MFGKYIAQFPKGYYVKTFRIEIKVNYFRGMLFIEVFDGRRHISGLLFKSLEVLEKCLAHSRCSTDLC